MARRPPGATGVVRMRAHRAALGGMIATVALVALLLAPGASDGILPPTGAARPPPISTGVVLAAGAPVGWPEIHQNAQLTGVDPTSPLNSTNAPSLGVAWATDLYGAALDSPVVATLPGRSSPFAFIGTETGFLLALNVSDGAIVWGRWLGSPIRSTPIVVGGAVFVATDQNPSVLKLNASTGTTDCSVLSPAPIEGSPVVGTPRPGRQLLYVGTLDSATRTGPLLAISVANCSIAWQFTGYPGLAGSWDPVSYATNATGAPLVLFGTADPDSAVYALNASTGARVWRFPVYNPPPGAYDVGAGITVSLPGHDGFRRGIAYAPTKFGWMYAIDLGTGHKVWVTNVTALVGANESGRSTAALSGTDLIFGDGNGLIDLAANNGSERWHAFDPSFTESISSPAVAGSGTGAVAVFGDLAGFLDVVSVANGSRLYTYRTGGYITASPALWGANLLVASSDGFLYDFAPGGGNLAALPSASVSAPASNAVLANPNGAVVINGTASAPSGVASVEVAVQSGGAGGPWWDAATSSWSQGPSAAAASLGTPGGSLTNWSFALPVPSGGGEFAVTVVADSVDGQAGIHTVTSAFDVLASTSGPHVRLTSLYIPPGSGTIVVGGGFLAGETVNFSFAGTRIGSTVASSRGAVPATSVRIPTKSAFGAGVIVATGATSGRTASAALVVANEWLDGGYSALRNSFEPNDPVLYAHAKIGTASWLDLAWTFASKSSFAADPAIADGVVYAGDLSGHLSALTETNAGLLWTWTAPARAPIDVSPAVDPAAHLVFVATANGTLSAVSTDNGSTVWTATPGGNLSAPAVAAGAVLVLAHPGVLAAYTEGNGSLLWSRPGASSTSASFAVNASAGVTVLAAANGTVSAVNLGSGSTRWTHRLAGAVLAPPVLGPGAVFVEATDGNVSALALTNGSALWRVALGGRLTAPMALGAQHVAGFVGPTLFVATANDLIVELFAANGSEVLAVHAYGLVTGLALVQGVVAYTSATGRVGASRTYTDLRVWVDAIGGHLAPGPVILDGTVYAADSDGNLYAFTPYGGPPQ